MKEQTLLFLSSGARPRYKEDILRALALPANCELQFRYPKNIVNKDLWKEFKRKTCSNKRVLIGFLDRSSNSIPPTIIPCRFAELDDYSINGNFVVLRMFVKGYAKHSHINNVTDHLRTGYRMLPFWKHPVGQERTLDGYFCNRSIQNAAIRIEESTIINDWQVCVNELAQCNDFKEETFFPYVEEILQIRRFGDPRSLTPTKGCYKVKANSYVRVKVGYYHPDHSNTYKNDRDWIKIEVSSAIQSEQNHPISVDSPYDIQYVKLKILNSNCRRYGYVSLTRKYIDDDSFVGFRKPLRKKPDHPLFLFEIPFEIRANHWFNVLIIIVFGVLLAATHISSKLSSNILSICVVILFSILAAGTAVYGIKNPYN